MGRIYDIIAVKLVAGSVKITIEPVGRQGGLPLLEVFADDVSLGTYPNYTECCEAISQFVTPY